MVSFNPFYIIYYNYYLFIYFIIYYILHKKAMDAEELKARKKLDILSPLPVIRAGKYKITRFSKKNVFFLIFQKVGRYIRWLSINASKFCPKIVNKIHILSIYFQMSSMCTESKTSQKIIDVVFFTSRCLFSHDIGQGLNVYYMDI